MSFGSPDNGHRITFVEAEIEIRGASVMGWGTSKEVARQNVIEAYRRRMEDVKHSVEKDDFK